MLSQKSDSLYITLLLALWAIMLVIANPLGNFPLNDDWMYAHTVQSVVVNHNYHVADLYSPILITQVYWGALFCTVFGFSFTVLRFSVIALGIIGSVLFYFMLKRHSGNKPLSFFCTLLITLNPLYFCLANSFMSDVPFITFSVICISLCMEFINKPGTKLLLLVVIATLPAILTRQLGIILPIAFTITVILQRKQNILKRSVYLLPVVILTALLVIVSGSVQHRGWHPYGGAGISELLANPKLFSQSLERMGIVLYYCGFFLLPLLLIKGNPLKNMTKPQKIIAALITAVGLIPLIYSWKYVPVGNVANIPHLGPLTVKGEMDSVDFHYVPLMHALKVIAFFAALLLLLNLWAWLLAVIQAFKTGSTPSFLKQKVFLGLCITGYVALICVPDSFFDRYVLYLFPLVAAMLIPQAGDLQEIKRPPVFALSYALVFVLGIYAVAGTHDYIAWNSARWQAGDYLTKEQNISIHKIDAGYEYNGWNNGVWQPSPPGKSWWFVNDDEYVVSTEPQQGYDLIKSFPYTSYLHFGQKSVGVWHRRE